MKLSSAPLRASSNRSRIALLFLLFSLAVYFLVSPGRIGGSDATEMLHVAEAMGKGSLSIDPVPGWSFQGPDGRWYSRYGLGYPALLVPFMKAGSLAAQLVGRFPELYFTRFAASLVNPILTAAAAAVLLNLLWAMGFSTRRGLAVAALYAFGSIAFPETKDGLSEPAATLFLVLGWSGLRAGMTQARASKTMLGSLSLAAAVLTRPFLAAGILGPAFCAVPRPDGSRGRVLGALLLPLLAGAGVQLSYNLVRTGSMLGFGYGPAGAIFGFPSPSELAYRFLSILVAPGCGLIAWQPFLLLVPLGLGPLWRRSRIDFAVVAGSFLPLFLTVWSYEDWALAPRLLAPALPALAVVAAAALDSELLCTAVRRRVLWGVLFVLSVAAQLPTVLVPSIRMESRLVLEERQRAYWSIVTAPGIGGWRDVVDVATVPGERVLIYSSSGLPVGSPREWFEKSATMNSFAFWFVHAARLGVPRAVLTVLVLLQLALVVALGSVLSRRVFRTDC